ncbi:MAG: amidohydrolase/deacetylase family metallohydrolase [Chloroflexi bacterium]|nr:amidohydrolase/deacetylase family metallohydrolase [Chloroflexota bacterium]
MKNPTQTCDLLLRAATILDLRSGERIPGDIAIAGSTVRAVAPVLDGWQALRTIDLHGALLTPGLIDLHCHGYWGSTYWGIPLDPVAQRSGVTTAVDAGSAGAYNFLGFRKWICELNRVNTLAFLNISSIGLVHRTYELVNPAYADVDLAVGTAECHPDIVVGIKARIDTNTVGGQGIEPLIKARAAADALHLPLMVHIGMRPPELRAILEHMRQGDILTHCHTGRENRITDASGRLRDDVRAARDRGVLLDVGHGMGSFSFEVADRLLQAGEWPDTISTDVHAENVNGPVYDLPTTISKYLLLGMPLERALLRCTVAAASALGQTRSGVVIPGMQADLSAFQMEEGAFPLTDSYGETRIAQRRLQCIMTVQRGELMYLASGVTS